MRFDQSPPVAFHALCGTARTLRRPRLIAQLDHATNRAMTLVSAPPGTGKTTLVADWATTKPELQFLSLALDERFNEPGLLTSVLHSGLRSLDVVRPQADDFADSVLTLTDELALTPAPRRDVVIVIDDAQEMTVRELWADVNHLIGASPWWLHWIIISRVDPAFGLRRFQLNGQLGQIRVSDLAFDADEAAALLNLLGLDLPREAILRLTTWSEGWAAALCLAARAISTEGDDERPWEHLEFSETLVLDFLVEEVLDRLSAKDRTFLLRTSAADVVTADLAALLTGNVHAGSQLHRLERAGTFLLEVDQSGTQYRYHGLMATLLRARLHDESPEAATELTRIAAHWYAAHGYPDEAERHAIRAKEWDLAALLRMRRCATQLMRTGSMFSAREVAFPREAHRYSAVQLLAAIDSMNKHDRRTTELLLDKLATPDGTETQLVHDDEFVLMKNLVEIERARWISVGQRTEGAFATIRSIPSAGDELSGLSSYLLLREAELYLAASREAEAVRCYDELETSTDVPDWAADEARGLLALVDAANGAPARTMALIDSTRPPRAGDAGTWLRCASAVVHGLRGNVAGVRQCAEVLTHVAAPRSSLFAQCLPVIRAAGLPSVGTAATLDAPPTGLPTSIAIALGILDGVDRQGHRWVIDGELELAIVRARRAVGDASQRTLLELLLPWADSSMTGQHPRTPIELYVLLVIAELRSDREEAALRRAEHAIQLAGDAGVWGPLVTAEPEFKQLLGRHSWELGARHPNALQVLDNIRAIHPARMEALTDRERVVLHYLPTLMSNTEIAAEMVVSVNTVKTHLKSIYRKLGVDRRRDALVRARQVELL